MKNYFFKQCFFIATVAILNLTFFHFCFAAEPSGKDIMQLQYDRADGDDRKMTLTMRLINRQGKERIRTVKSMSKDYGKDKKTIMLFQKPADVKGTMFLSWEYDSQNKEDDKWLYMPAMKKVRRISGASKNEYFMGTDYTYDDMGDRNVDEDSHTLLGEENIGDKNCWKIKSVPLDPQDLYTHKILWIDKISYLIIKGEYYDKDGLVKTYQALDVRKQDGFWLTFRSEMNNVSRQHKTILEIESMQFNTGIQDSLFQVTTLQRGRL